VSLGRASATPAHTGSKTALIRLTASGRRALKRLSKATISVRARANRPGGQLLPHDVDLDAEALAASPAHLPGLLSAAFWRFQADFRNADATVKDHPRG
jgi:hypothetical protein